jgi:F0F1-type ATP synthase membrane subunit b/b'
MGEISKEEMRERIGNIDLIRDIIFGSKLQEYDNRLDKLESNLPLVEKEIRDRIEQIKADCLTELRASVSSLEEKIQSLNLNSQKDNADIRQLIDRSYKNFSHSLESIDKTVGSQTTSIRKELSETREKLQEDTRHLKSQVFDELERRFSNLTDAKLSRNDMAEILFELGLKIKKAEFTPELRDTSHTNSTDDVLLIEASKVSE